MKTFDWGKANPGGDVEGDPVVFDDAIGTESYFGTNREVLITLVLEAAAALRPSEGEEEEDGPPDPETRLARIVQFIEGELTGRGAE